MLSRNVLGVSNTVKVPPVSPELSVSGWFAALVKVPQPNVLKQEIVCDYLVIGGGWMGLHCARRLAELQPDAAVVLVDAGRIGNNAAGRCAGFAINLAHNPRNRNFAENIRSNNEEQHINLEGIAYINKAVTQFGVECEWSPEGKYHGAASKRGIACLHKFAKALDNLGQSYRWIDQSEIQSLTGSAYYLKALFVPGTVLLQPAKYLQSAWQALPKNCIVYEDTPITEVTYNRTSNRNTRHYCCTPLGVVRPKTIFLCNNGYITQFGFYDKTAIPLYTYASLTSPLSAADSNRLNARATFGVIPADSFGTTVRRTADNRLFIRNLYTYARDFQSTHKDLVRAKKLHQIAFDRRYPSISSMGFEASWGGMMTLSHNGGMIFGQLAPDIYATGFCNGTGVSRGAAFGKALADFALGKTSRTIKILLERTAPNRGLPPWITKLGVSATTELRLYQARREV